MKNQGLNVNIRDLSLPFITSNLQKKLKNIMLPEKNNFDADMTMIDRLKESPHCPSEEKGKI